MLLLHPTVPQALSANLQQRLQVADGFGFAVTTQQQHPPRGGDGCQLAQHHALLVAVEQVQHVVADHQLETCVAKTCLEGTGQIALA